MVEMKNGDTELAAAPAKVFELLDRAGLGLDVTVRDDQQEFSTLVDGARVCRGNGGRFRLIDTGRLSLFELEWLGEAGADLYTSDEARPRLLELDLLTRACLRGRAAVAYFHHGPITGEGSDGKNSMAFLGEAGRLGIYLHFSSRDKERAPDSLSALAAACRSAGSWLVYYHHGPLNRELGGLAKEGAWIHLSDKDLSSAEDVLLLTEIMRENSCGKPRFVLHIEEGLPLQETLDLERTGAFLLFKTPPSDYRSAFRCLEQRVERRRLDHRTYHLYTTFLP